MPQHQNLNKLKSNLTLLLHHCTLLVYYFSSYTASNIQCWVLTSNVSQTTAYLRKIYAVLSLLLEKSLISHTSFSFTSRLQSAPSFMHVLTADISWHSVTVRFY